MVVERLADSETLLQHWERGFELGFGSDNRLQLGLFLLPLAIENGKLGLVLGDRVDEEFALHRDQARRRARRRREAREGIGFVQCRLQPRDIEAGRHEIAGQMPAFRLVDGRVELDEHLAGLHALAVMNMNGAHDAGLERLDQFGATAGDDLALRRGNDVDLAEIGPGDRGGEQRHDGVGDSATDRGRRRLHDFQRRRQEVEIRAVATEGGGIFNGLHECLPGNGRASHNGRRS